MRGVNHEKELALRFTANPKAVSQLTHRVREGHFGDARQISAELQVGSFGCTCREGDTLCCTGVALEIRSDVDSVNHLDTVGHSLFFP
jgi:hypothetical protein